MMVIGGSICGIKAPMRSQKASPEAEAGKAVGSEAPQHQGDKRGRKGDDQTVQKVADKISAPNHFLIVLKGGVKTQTGGWANVSSGGLNEVIKR